MREKRLRSGNQMNMYLTDELAEKVDSVGLAMTKKDGRARTRQDVFKHAFKVLTAMLDAQNGMKG